MKDLYFILFYSKAHINFVARWVAEPGMTSYPRWICLVPFSPPRTSTDVKEDGELWCQLGHSPINLLDSFTQSYSCLLCRKVDRSQWGASKDMVPKTELLGAIWAN
jgi:hypothetical protein